MKFYLPDMGESLSDGREVPGFKGGDIYDFINMATEYYHSECDGLESTWPLTFAIVDDYGLEVGRYEVDRDFEPNFTWHRI